MKTLNIILIIIISFLLLMSTIALILIHWQLFNLELSISPIGLEYYLSSYGKYKALFAGTVAVCAAYFGLLRARVSAEANKSRLKQDYFAEWKTVVQARATEVEKNDLFMLRAIVEIRHSLYNDLYDLNFVINSKNQLTEIFNKHIGSRVDLFETQNNRHIGMGGVYRDDNFSYAFNSFHFIFRGMINDAYAEFGKDLKQLYLSNINEFRHIDSNLFKIAQQNYNPI